jgi:hypothetical protein
MADVRKEWNKSLRDFAPIGIDPGQHNGIGDAFRHYETAGILAGHIGEQEAVTLGDIAEFLGGNPEAEKRMDRNNNRLGAKAGAAGSDHTGIALEFMNDVATGKVIVQDRDTGVFRESRASDLPHRDGDALEDRYRPDRSNKMKDALQDNDTLIA